MPTIRVLPEDLASQIAAGEVVERPASALKELLENSLDAQATRIDVEVEGGGISRLAVLDDGHGMSEADAKLSLSRHATSKLQSFADLDQLASYGFRGEGLPSIASVSRLTLRTRRADSAAGVELRVEGGARPSVRPAGCAPGTLVEVEDLFFNVPARRKFLRSTGTESGHLTEVAESLALANPEISLSLRREGRLVRRWLRVGNRAERVRDALDEELTTIQGERGPLRLEAHLSRPERARTGASGLRLLLNGRPIKDRSLAVAVAQAYGSVLERGRYPRGVVYLDLPPELVDFNVHPQKLEVRFAQPRAVSDAVYGILSRDLATRFSLPPPSRYAKPSESPPPTAPPALADSRRRGHGSPRRDSEARSFARPAPLAGLAPSLDSPSNTPERHRAPPPPLSPASHPPPTTEPGPNWSELSFVAQVRQTYLICEGPTGLYVIDQHAAAERVTYDRLRRQYRARDVPSQALLFPVEVELTAEEDQLIRLHADEFRALGLDLRRLESGNASVHAVPRLLELANPERLLRDLLSETLREEGRAFSAAVDRALATMACHASLRAGDPVSPDEARALLIALDGTDFAGHCPHGRPIVSHTPWSELERKVGRR